MATTATLLVFGTGEVFLMVFMFLLMMGLI